MLESFAKTTKMQKNNKESSEKARGNHQNQREQIWENLATVRNKSRNMRKNIGKVGKKLLKNAENMGNKSGNMREKSETNPE